MDRMEGNMTDDETTQERLERLRAERDTLRASGADDAAADLDEQIAEAEGQSLLGDGAPRA